MENWEQNEPTGVMHDPVSGKDSLTEVVDEMDERVKASLRSAGAAGNTEEKVAVVDPDDRASD
ncbi:hypothetical protein [Tomitella biformata]|uniref:hypothetical protein n=1 Tax=Tomitella biformata TaxID=630403 RepID=UPI0011DCD88D|nr:hypothetical protein [Tomitella biformata]